MRLIHIQYVMMWTYSVVHVYCTSLGILIKTNVTVSNNMHYHDARYSTMVQVYFIGAK